MLGARAHDTETLDAIGQEDELREVVLRMARLAERGKLGEFVGVVDADSELDESTKAWIWDVADEPFLEAAGRYLVGTRHG